MPWNDFCSREVFKCFALPILFFIKCFPSQERSTSGYVVEKLRAQLCFNAGELWWQREDFTGDHADTHFAKHNANDEVVTWQ
jgi:hypothetical protein